MTDLGFGIAVGITIGALLMGAIWLTYVCIEQHKYYKNLMKGRR